MGPPKVLYDDYGDSMGQANREFAEAMGWPVLWRNKGGYEFKGATKRSAPLDAGIPAAVVPERGGSDRMPERYGTYIGNFADGLHERHASPGDDLPGPEPDRWLVCEDDTHAFPWCGLVHFMDGVTLGTEVEEGRRLRRSMTCLGRRSRRSKRRGQGQFFLRSGHTRS